VPLYSVSDAARHINVPRRTFDTWVRGYSRWPKGKTPVTGAPVGHAAAIAGSRTVRPFLRCRHEVRASECRRRAMTRAEGRELRRAAPRCARPVPDAVTATPAGPLDQDPQGGPGPMPDPAPRTLVLDPDSGPTARAWRTRSSTRPPSRSTPLPSRPRCAPCAATPTPSTCPRSVETMNWSTSSRPGSCP
jgi:hypothetical protein